MSRRTAWIALLAVFLAALAPSLAQAVRAAGTPGAERWLEVCTAAGLVVVPDGDSAPADDGRHASPQGPHCPFCTGHAPTLAPPPRASAFVAVASLPRVVPPRQVSRPSPDLAWPAARSRAPPARC